MPRNWLSYTSPTKGDFHRFYLPGTYTLITRCAGYKVDTTIVVVPNSNDSSVTVNIKLIPDSTAIQNYGMRVISNQYVTTSSNRTYPVRALGIHDGVHFQLDNGKWINIAMAKPITNDSGNDFTVYRSSGTSSATVKVSNNWKGPWTTIGTANSANSAFNIGSVGFDTVRYVRLEASGTFYLDAIEEYVLISNIEEKENHQMIIDNFSIYPSMVSSWLKVDCNIGLNKDVQFSVYDVLGINIKSFKMNAGEMKTSVNLKNLKSGIYFVKADNTNLTTRITVIR
jgi:hypothetical protein